MSSAYAIEEKDSLILDLSQIHSLLKQKWRHLTAIALIFVLLSSGLSAIFYKETYESAGTLLFDMSDAPKIITNTEFDGQFLKDTTHESNPYKNQEELLKSRLIADRVFKQLQKAHLQVAKSSTDLMNKVIQAEHIKDTNFIRLTAKAHQPATAQKIAQIYVNAYLALMNEISYAPLKQKKRFFETQVAQAEKQLNEMNHQIRLYQEQYEIVDLAEESQSQVQQFMSLDTQMKSVEADLAQKRAEAKRIRAQLRAENNSLEHLLEAVAKGQDNGLSNLHEKLQESQKDYDTKALVYASTNPDMIQLQKKIDVLKHQITDQQILTVGQVNDSKLGMIKDSVRTQMVNRLASADTDSVSLQRRLGTLKSQYQEMKEGLQSLPQHQLDYERLQLNKKNQEDVLTKLKQNLAEVEIQEAAVRKKLMVIDMPNHPDKPLAPLRWHIILFGSLLGTFLFGTSLLGFSLLNKKQLEGSYLEQHLELAVLGQIPWIQDDRWQFYRYNQRLEVTNPASSEQALIRAYQDLSLNLKVQRKQSEQNALVVSSVAESGGQPYILANLAVCLAQSGDRVLLIDANLRKPGLNKAFQHELDYERGLPELINTVSEVLHRQHAVEPEEILNSVKAVITPSDVHPQLNYLNAGLTLENTFEFLNAKSFDILIKVLQLEYDWVLINAPPFLKHPDGSVLLSYVDGLLLIVEKETTEKQLLTAQKKLSLLKAPLVGVVIRST